MNTTVLDEQTLQFGRLLHYAGFAVLLISGAIAHTQLFAPIEAKTLDAEMRIDELTQSKQNAGLIQAEHAKLSQRLKEISAHYAALQQRVPTSAEAGSFLRDVSAIARDQDLTVSNFQPAQAVEEDGYTTMEVQFSGTGSFTSICSFFDRLSKIERLAKVKDIMIATDGRADTYPMKATLIIYFGLQGNRSGTATKGVSHG